MTLCVLCIAIWQDLFLLEAFLIQRKGRNTEHTESTESFRGVKPERAREFLDPLCSLLRKYTGFPLTLTLSLEGRGEGEGDSRLQRYFHDFRVSPRGMNDRIAIWQDLFLLEAFLIQRKGRSTEHAEGTAPSRANSVFSVRSVLKSFFGFFNGVAALLRCALCVFVLDLAFFS